jgi:hypothetical protein
VSERVVACLLINTHLQQAAGCQLSGYNDISHVDERLQPKGEAAGI